MALIVANPFAFSNAEHYKAAGDGVFGDARGDGYGMHAWAGKSPQFQMLGSDSTEDGDGYGYGSLSTLSCFTFLACAAPTDFQASIANVLVRMEP